MSNQDFVKQIILKFKTEGNDQVKRAADAMSKNFSGRELERFMKNLDQVQAKFGQAGKGMSVEMKKVNEYFKELNNNQFQKAERNLDRLGRLINRQIQNLDRLKREGASQEVIKQREQSLMKATGAFDRMAEQTPAPRLGRLESAVRGMGNNMPGPGGLAIGAVNIVGAVAKVAEQMFQARRDFIVHQQENKQFVGERMKAQAMDIFAGNMSRSVLYGNKQRSQRIQQNIDAETGAANKAATAGSIAGGAGVLGGLGVAGYALAGGAALLSAPVVLGAAAVGAGAYGINKGIQYFRGGGKEAVAQQARERAEATATSETMDLEYYKEFAKNAQMRYNYQRQLGLGDATALDVRAQFRRAGVLDEGQMSGMMLGFRKFGASTAPFVGAQTADMAKQMGMSQDSAMNLMQSVATTNRGGIGTAKKDLEELFARAVDAGINDSGLIEEYQKTATALMQSLGSRMSAGDIAGSMSNFLTEGSDQRNLQALLPAIQSYGQTLKGTSPLMQTKGVAGMIGMARNQSGDVDMLAFQYLSQMSPTELATLNPNDPVLKSLGIDQSKISEFKKQQSLGTLRSNLGASSGLKLLSKAQSKGSVMNEGEQRMLAVGFGMQNVSGQDIRAVQSFLKANLNSVGGAGEGLQFEGAGGALTGVNTVKTMSAEDVQRQIKGTNISAGRAIEGQAEGQNLLDQKTYDIISKNMDAIFQMFQKQASEVMSNIDQGVLAQPIENIGKAADSVADALYAASNKIRGGAGLPADTRSGSKQAGEGE